MPYVDAAVLVRQYRWAIAWGKFATPRLADWSQHVKVLAKFCGLCAPLVNVHALCDVGIVGSHK